jgi:hypothetical protein
VSSTILFVSIVVLFREDLCSCFFLTSGVRDTVIVEERSDAEASEAEPEEAERDRDGNTAAASGSDDQPARGTYVLAREREPGRSTGAKTRT